MERGGQANSARKPQLVVARRLACWTDSFIEATAGTASPALLRRWAAISIVASVLEKKVWISNKKGRLYPNQYVFLVSPPGIGKTLMTNTAYKMLSEIKGQHIASSSVTSASIIDDLRECDRRLMKMDQTPSVISYNSLKIISNELSVLLPAWDSSMMSKLTDIYDGLQYSERRRGSGLHFKIDSPQLNILAACSPSFLRELLPEGAWDQGFMSRTILIYDEELIRQDPFGDGDEYEIETPLLKDLAHDLDILAGDDTYGPLAFAPEALTAWRAWFANDGNPRPDHPKLINYNTRRPAHLLKLCMVSCMSRSRGPFITLEHYQEALNWLLEAEAHMGGIFRAMTAGGDQKIIKETWHFVYTMWMKYNKPVEEGMIVEFISERAASSHSVVRILDVMIRSKILEEKIEKVGKCFVPRPPKKGQM